MAGRLLPIGLAMVTGVAIGVATFDGEFKEQRRKRLEEEYKRDIAAISAADTRDPFVSSSATQPHQQIPLQNELQSQTKSSGVSSLFGLWTRKKNLNPEITSPTSKETPES